MTDEDRALHDAAARTAGYDIWWKDSICKGGRVLAAFIGEHPWRPLDDSGDSFRLMLDTHTALTVYQSMICGLAPAASGKYVDHRLPLNGQDKEAIARRVVLELTAQLEKK